jgi:hypothetical protein
MPRLDIDRRIGRPVDSRLVAAKFCELLEVGDDALSVDGRQCDVSQFTRYKTDGVIASEATQSRSVEIASSLRSSQ